jgi:hypothetical protein
MRYVAVDIAVSFSALVLKGAAHRPLSLFQANSLFGPRLTTTSHCNLRRQTADADIPDGGIPKPQEAARRNVSSVAREVLTHANVS